jgi:pyruvate,water dikinase
MRLHGMMEQKMLWNWKAPIINDFYVMVFYGALRKMCDDWCGDASLQNGLICGEGGLQSDEPAKLLIRMTAVVREDSTLRKLVTGEPTETLPDLIGGDPRFSEFNHLMTVYLDRFGLRCADELKLESFSYQDQPWRLFEIIRGYLKANDSSHQDLAAINRREKNIRELAEQQADDALAKSRTWFPRRLLFRMVLNNARNGVRNRENMRFARTRIYGVLRRMLRSIGGHFETANILDDREDIFYLTIDEVWDFVKGTAVTTGLRDLAKLRKREFDVYRLNATLPPDNRFETFGMAYHGNVYRNRDEKGCAGFGESLSGIGCCPGIVAGRAQVVRDPSVDAYFKGDILVAERTEPGWVPFFPAFSGILVERGSVLSHSAIVAREMGIPTIVGISGLTRRVHTGDSIRMDGQKGTVEMTSST